MSRPIGQLMPRLFGLPVQGWIGIACWLGSSLLGLNYLGGSMMGFAMGLFLWGAVDGAAERRAAKDGEPSDSHA